MNNQDTERTLATLAECQRRLEGVPGVAFIAQSEKQGIPVLLVALELDDAAVRKKVNEICGATPVVFEVSGRIDAS